MKFKNAAKRGTGFCTLKSGGILREMAAAVATGLIVVCVLWSCILGMSGADDDTVPRPAEVSHDGR
jgi:hypothetical protein